MFMSLSQGDHLGRFEILDTIAEDTERGRFTVFRVPEMQVRRALVWRAELEWSPSVDALMSVLNDVIDEMFAGDRLEGITRIEA